MKKGGKKDKKEGIDREGYKRRILWIFIVICVLIILFFCVGFFARKLESEAYKERPTPPESGVEGILNESSANPETGLPTGLEKIETKIKSRNLTYLEKEWKNILLKNSIISALDLFFTKISLVFRILFGEPYSLSFILFMVIVLWLIVFLKTGEVLHASGMQKGISYIIGFVFSVIIAQLKVYRRIIEFTGEFIFSHKYKWVRYVLIGVVFILLVLFYKLPSMLSTYLEERRKKREEEEAEESRKVLTTFTKEMMETQKEIGGEE